MSRIFFLRHAESANNARGEGEARNCDPGLTELGETQQALLPEVLDVRSFTGGILVSPMRRTLRTASSLVQEELQARGAGGGASPTSTSSPRGPVSISIEPLLCEEGGVFEGDRTLTDAERKAQFSTPQQGLSYAEQREVLLQPLARGGTDGGGGSEILAATKNMDVPISLPRLDFAGSTSSEDAAAEDAAGRTCFCGMNSEWKASVAAGVSAVGDGPGSSSTTGAGWWPGGRESKAQYAARCEHVAKTLKANAANFHNALLVTHGKFLDGLLKALLLGSAQETTSTQHDGGAVGVGGITFLTGGACLSCVQVSEDGERVGVDFLNLPILRKPEHLTGHKVSGFQMKAWGPVA